jgi:hypothetical protein
MLKLSSRFPRALTISNLVDFLSARPSLIKLDGFIAGNNIWRWIARARQCARPRARKLKNYHARAQSGRGHL